MNGQLGFAWLEEARQERRKGTRGLLADTPRSRRNDPETSHDAAERVRKSGLLRGHQTKILETVRQHPGATYTEIAEYSGIERHAVARRLKELEPIYLKRGPERVVKGRPLLTWWPV